MVNNPEHDYFFEELGLIMKEMEANVKTETTKALIALIDSEDNAVFKYLIELGWTPPFHCDEDAKADDQQ